MAGNFNISVARAGDHVHLKLNGDFDGSSACELMNLLSNSDLSSASKILVNTDSLNHIHTFGVDVLHHLLSAATVRNFPLTFTGKLSARFASE
jgi:anti-anti-sigma regulatory factor